MDACSMQPWKPGIPAFGIEILINLFFYTNLIILLAMTPKKIFPSTLSNEMGRNCSRCLEFFSFGIYIPFANPQSSAMNFSMCMTRKSYQRDAKTLGHLLYNVYDIPLIPGVLLALTFRSKSFTSPGFIGELSNVSSGDCSLLSSPKSRIGVSANRSEYFLCRCASKVSFCTLRTLFFPPQTIFWRI